MSTERPDHSQESFDLKKAVLAGVAKSRSWMAVPRIEPHAVVVTIILFATVLVFGVLPFLQKRQNDTAVCVFSATIVPLSFGYVVHQNWGFLRWVWEHPLGKVFYGLLASGTVTFCKVWTDQQIRWLTQSNPSLFSSAQPPITVLNIIIATLVEIGILIYMFIAAKIVWCYAIDYFLDTLLGFLNIFFRSRRLANRLRTSLGSWLTNVANFVAYAWGMVFVPFILLFFRS
jgi:hypothetical protein